MDDKYQKYQNTAFSSEQWYIIKNAIDEDIDVKDLANPKFSVSQLKMLIEARKNDINLDGLTDPEIKEDQLRSILEKIANEMGLYNEHYENVRRKWIRNITWIIMIISSITIIIAMLYVTKDDWLKYFEDLYLRFNCDSVQLEAGDKFEPASYIKAYDPESVISFPNKKEIDTSKPGTYWAVYHISNGKKEKEMKLLVEVKDTTPPVIRLKENNIVVSDTSGLKPDKYITSVIDNVDGDLKSKITIEMKNSKIIYRAKDSSGNEAEETLRVTIEQPKKEVVEPSTNNDVTPDSKKSEIENEESKVTPAPVPLPETHDVPVTAQNKFFPFTEGQTFEQTYQECIAAGNAAVASGQANTAACIVYDEDGIHKGYNLSFN